MVGPKDPGDGGPSPLVIAAVPGEAVAPDDRGPLPHGRLPMAFRPRLPKVPICRRPRRIGPGVRSRRLDPRCDIAVGHQPPGPA